MGGFALILAMVCVIAVHVETVTVRPSRCPTNKIAPYKRKRFATWDVESIRDESNGRTFGAFYDLLVPERFQDSDQSSNLQENPQNDPEDCGDIEDYDENDLSSITPNNRRQYGNTRFFFSGYQPQRPSNYRPPPQNYPPKRPPQGGYFGNNGYRPPLQQDPSIYVKPVNEIDRERPRPGYRPSGIVGVPLNHIVGMASIVPSEAPETTRRPQTPPPLIYHPSNQYLDQPSETVAYPRRERPRTQNNNSGILGSFVDLLFK